MKMIKLLILLALIPLTMTPVFAEDTLEDLERSFRPYKDGVPQIEGVTPGMVINASNVDQAKEVLDDEMYQHIKDGWVEITVGETTDFILHDGYIQASKDNMNSTSLGSKPGELNGFVAGRAFLAEPDINDPRAGEKLAWNYKYGYNWGDNAAISPFYWRYRNMKTDKIERQIKFGFHFFELEASC